MPLIVLAIIASVVIGYARIGALPHWLFYPGETLFVGGRSLHGLVLFASGPLSLARGGVA
jgi:hypothetical protein